MTLGQKIAAKAASHIGEHEEPMGSNTGPFVNQCLAYVGAAPAEPWCAAFACYVVGSVLTESGQPARSHPKTASSGAVVAWGKAQNRVIGAAAAQPGDLGMVRDAASPTGYRHTTIIERVISRGMVTTIEGNEGDAVKRCTRMAVDLTLVRPYV